MRNLHKHIEKEFRKECLCWLMEWEHLEKISNYKNHYRFTLKCIGQDIIPYSLKLKTPIYRLRAQENIHKAERKLLKECPRNISNNTALCGLDRNRCEAHLISFLVEIVKYIRNAKMSYIKLGRRDISRSWNAREENMKDCLTKKRNGTEVSMVATQTPKSEMATQTNVKVKSIKKSSQRKTHLNLSKCFL